MLKAAWGQAGTAGGWAWFAAASAGGALLLLGSGAAQAAAFSFSNATGSLGIVAALVALLGADTGETGGVAVYALGGAMVGTAGWVWGRSRRATSGGDPVRRAGLLSRLRRERAAPEAAPRSLCARRGIDDLPDGVSCAEVLAGVRRCYVDLQAAWDADDEEALRALATAEVVDEIVALRAAHDGVRERSEVLVLDADLLAFDTFGGGYLASVEFSGLVREAAGAAAVPFRELWMLACDADDLQGWRLVRQQALF